MTYEEAVTAAMEQDLECRRAKAAFEHTQAMISLAVSVYARQQGLVLMSIIAGAFK